jgi:hypothetical protein
MTVEDWKYTLLPSNDRISYQSPTIKIPRIYSTKKQNSVFFPSRLLSQTQRGIAAASIGTQSLAASDSGGRRTAVVVVASGYYLEVRGDRGMEGFAEAGVPMGCKLTFAMSETD